jgi:hypothetical protein
MVPGRMHARAPTGVESVVAWERLARRIGASAATTYAVRRRHGFAAAFALRLARSQAERGVGAGLECVPYRIGSEADAEALLARDADLGPTGRGGCRRARRDRARAVELDPAWCDGILGRAG